MCKRTQINKWPITWKGTLGVGFLPPSTANYFLWAKLQQISYKYLRKGRQRTCSLCPRHKATPGIVFGRQSGRLHAGDTRSHGCVSDPASKMSSLRGAVPRSALPQSILNEQTQGCPMMPAAEIWTYSNVTWSKANFSPVIKSEILFQEGSVMNALLFKLSNKIWNNGKVHFNTRVSLKIPVECSSPVNSSQHFNLEHFMNPIHGYFMLLQNLALHLPQWFWNQYSYESTLAASPKFRFF